LMLFSPLEQFSIIKLYSLVVGPFEFSFTNSSLLVLLSSSLSLVLFNLVCSGAKLVPGCWQSIVELFYEFVYFSVLSENVKKDGSSYFPILFSIFFFIFSCNLFGMVPYSFTVTSHCVVTVSLAAFFFLAINVVGARKHGIQMLSLFLPSGAPLLLAPLLVVIEAVSYSFRVVSLALRLFANMMSGHCLLKILAGFAWTMFASGGLLSLAHLLPLLVIFAIVGLELAIAFLQAYVFTVLLCIYLNDALNLH
jgi:ATP synthase subunit 6